jgi:hypothetical protein
LELLVPETTDHGKNKICFRWQYLLIYLLKVDNGIQTENGNESPINQSMLLDDDAEEEFPSPAVSIPIDELVDLMDAVHPLSSADPIRRCESIPTHGHAMATDTSPDLLESSAVAHPYFTTAPDAPDIPTDVDTGTLPPPNDSGIPSSLEPVSGIPSSVEPVSSSSPAIPADSDHDVDEMGPFVSVIPPTPQKALESTAGSSSVPVSPIQSRRSSSASPATNIIPPIVQSLRQRSKTRSPSPAGNLRVPEVENRPLRRSPRSRSGTPKA